MDALIEICNYDDLDVVQITFNFWYYIAEMLTLDTSTSQPSSTAVNNIGNSAALAPLSLEQRAAKKAEWRDTYAKLIDIMIKHLRYPPILTEWTAKERDEFREFRHVIGDVLKDCVMGKKK